MTKEEFVSLQIGDVIEVIDHNHDILPYGSRLQILSKISDGLHGYNTEIIKLDEGGRLRNRSVGDEYDIGTSFCNHYQKLILDLPAEIVSGDRLSLIDD